MKGVWESALVSLSQERRSRLTVLSLLDVSKTLLSASSAAKSPTMFSSVTATTSSVRFL